jgi:hypothetical protein
VWDNVLLLVVAGVLATLTYWFVENPVRHSRYLGKRRWASLVMGLCLIVTTLVVTGYEARRPTLDLGSVATATAGSVCHAPTTGSLAQMRGQYTDGRHPDGPAPDGPPQSVVMIGDSTACTLLPGLEAVGPSYGLQFHDGAVIGCGVVSGEQAPFYVSGLNYVAYTAKCQSDADHAEVTAIERYDPRVIVWGSTDERSSFVDSTSAGSKVLVSGSAEWKSVMLKRMNDRVDTFIAAGAKVILVLEPPATHKNPGLDSDDIAYEHLNELLKEVAARHPGEVGTVNLEPRVCPSGPPCPYLLPAFDQTHSKGGNKFACGSVMSPVPCGEQLRPDGVHYSPPASLWVAEWLVPRIAAEAKVLLSHR